MQSIVKLPLLCSVAVILFPSVASFRPPIYTSSPSFLHTPSIEINSNSRLFAKPKKKKGKTRNIAVNNRNFETSEESALPANLKRKVQAKRPPLGHIIPEDTRTKGCEFF